jgi:hypothetical protein
VALATSRTLNWSKSQKNKGQKGNIIDLIRFLFLTMCAMKGITYIENFLASPDALFTFLLENVDWDERIAARKTASFGVAYNYAQMSYPLIYMTQAVQDDWQHAIPTTDTENGRMSLTLRAII